MVLHGSTWLFLTLGLARFFSSLLLLWLIYRRGLRLLLLHFNARDTLDGPSFFLLCTGTLSRRSSSCLVIRCTLTDPSLVSIKSSCRYTLTALLRYLIFNARDTLNGPLLSFVVRSYRSGALSRIPRILLFLLPVHTHGALVVVVSVFSLTRSTRSIHRFFKPFGMEPIASSYSTWRCTILAATHVASIGDSSSLIDRHRSSISGNDPPCQSFHPSAQSRPSCDPTHGSMALCHPVPLSLSPFPGIISNKCWIKRPIGGAKDQFIRNYKHMQCCY